MLTDAPALLDFETPHGIKLHVSSLPSPNFATSYTIANTGVVDGSLSYLYTSLPLAAQSKCTHIPLRHVIRGYRSIGPLAPPQNSWEWEIWHGGKRVDKRPSLLYGRLFLPQRRLEALYLRRPSPTSLLKISAVSDEALPNGGTVLAEVKRDVGKYSAEFLCSTDSALLGFRGLYNFGPDAREQRLKSKHLPIICGPTTIPTSRPSAADVKRAYLESVTEDQPPPSPPSLFSLGTEIYYGLLNSTLGFSTGLRFTTLYPPHNSPPPNRAHSFPSSSNPLSHPTNGGYSSFPYTMTLILNPLMGNLSSTYAVKAGPHLSLCSKFDFNFYSYESGWEMGGELWRMKNGSSASSEDVEWARKMIRPDWIAGSEGDKDILRLPAFSDTRPVSPSLSDPKVTDEDVAGVLKARVDQNWRIGLLWEGRFKEVLFSVGASLDLKRREQIFRSLGCEIAYSS